MPSRSFQELRGRTIILDLSQTAVTLHQLGNVAHRVNGAGATNIRAVVILESKMPGLNCRCGHRISFGTIPCSDQWLFISDTAFDSFSGQVDAERVFLAMQSFLKCPVCARLWLFWNGFKHPAQEYMPAEVSVDPGPKQA